MQNHVSFNKRLICFVLEWKWRKRLAGTKQKFGLRYIEGKGCQIIDVLYLLTFLLNVYFMLLV
jgi:hypothetical protein